MKAFILSAFLAMSPVDGDKLCLKNCELSDIGTAFITHFEGYRPFIYKDSAGLATIGIGHLIKPGEKFPEPLLPEDATSLLKKDTTVAVKAVNRRTNVKLKQHQADSLISFTYNLGEGSLAKSKLLRKVNTGDHEEVPELFLAWNKVRIQGKYIEVRGLTIRRQAEAELYQG